MNLDIFMTSKNQQGQTTISYIKAPNFNTTFRLAVIVCPKGTNVQKA